MEAATLTRPVTFQSQSHNLRLVRYNESKIPDPLGGEGTTVPGLRYEFSDHRLVVDDDLIERDREIMRQRARILGRDFTGEPDTLEWLRGHKEHGEAFAEILLRDMAPPPNEALRTVTRLATNWDRDGLRAFLDTERETYERDVVIEACEEALAEMERYQQEHAQQQEQQNQGA